MNHSLEQLLIDAHIARREKLVSEDVLREILSLRALQQDDSRRLSSWLEERGTISKQEAAAIDEQGSAYHDALVALGMSTAGGDGPGEFDTLMEGSSLIQPDSATPPSSDQETPPVLTRESARIRYQKTRPHAEGGLGRVWLASDGELKRQVALKEIQPEHADDIGCQMRFMQEAEITGSLEHPGIVPVYGLGRHGDGRPYYAMRFIEGQTLKEAIDDLFRDAPALPYRDRHWMVRLRRLLNRFLDVCQTVDYAHSRKVIHRDIKPGNIMLGAYGETLLVDWGLAKSLSADSSIESLEVAASPKVHDHPMPELTMQGTAVGTPAYMSPEQANGGNPIPVGLQSDIFSLGATLFHLLVGAPPTTDSDAGYSPSQLTSESGLSPHQRRGDVPRPLASICHQAMALRPSDRYETAKELCLDIENWLSDQPVTAHTESHRERLARWVRNHPTTVVSSAIASVLILVATMAAVSFRSQYLLDLQRQQAETNRLEESHLQQVAASVDAAKASALAEIRNDRFEAALEFLNNALALLADEPSLDPQLQAIREMQDRTKRLLAFTRYMERAEELTFRDSSRRSSILLQRGLQAVGAFRQLEWWNAMPSQDLDPAQLHALRTKVYRAMFLLTALRLKETIPTDLNVTEMLKLGSRQSKISNASSVLLCDLLDAYRTSQGAELGRRFAVERGRILNQVIQGLAFQQPAINWNPRNASDLYIMGTSLGYMVLSTAEEQRQRFETILGVQNAEETSRLMLTQASELKRDHYWTQLVRAFFEAARGEHESAWRSYSHTISLNPQHWVGYAWLALSQRDYALTLEDDAPDRQKFFMQAVRNSERAVDLKQDARGAHTIRAEALAWLKRDMREAIASYLHALNFQEPFDGIDDPVVEDVDRWDLERTLDWCRSGLNEYPENHALHGCIAWGELIFGNLEEAESAAIQALELAPENREAKFVLASVESSKGHSESAETGFAALCSAHENWFHAWYGRGKNAEQLGQLSSAQSHFEQALRSSETGWQSLYARRGLARLALSIRQADALEQVAQAILAADIERLDSVLKAARESQASEAIQLLEAYHRSLEPITTLESDDTPTNAPLLNGDFELGLTACWGDTLDKLDVPAWQRFKGSLATATVVEGEFHSGKKSLHIDSAEDYGKQAYAELSQQIPVVPGSRYRCTVWVRSEDCADKAIRVMADEETVVAAPPGSYNWQRVEADFDSPGSILTLRLRCAGAASVWLDSISIRRL